MDTKTIKISTANYERLIKVGKMNDTFDRLIGRLLDSAHLVAGFNDQKPKLKITNETAPKESIV